MARVMIVHMTRRELAQLAAGAAILLDGHTAQAAEATKYTGALDGFENKVDLAGFDPVAYTKKLHDSAPLRMTFAAQTRAQGRAVAEGTARQDCRPAGRLSLPRRSPLHPQTLEVRDFPAYRREKFVFESGRVSTFSAICSRRPAGARRIRQWFACRDTGAEWTTWWASTKTAGIAP